MITIMNLCIAVTLWMMLLWRGFYAWEKAGTSRKIDNTWMETPSWPKIIIASVVFIMSMVIFLAAVVL